jgi:ATP-dependent Lon protease
VVRASSQTRIKRGARPRFSRTGLVLPVGGIKEKVLAAKRASLRHVILPVANRKDLVELPDNVREAVEFVLVNRIDDALTAAIPELAERLNHVGV